MAFNETNFIRGPAIVTWGPAAGRYTCYTKGDIAVRIRRDTFDVRTSMHGLIDVRARSMPVAEVTFTPAGEIENLTTLFPYDQTDIGASIFPATDETLVIHTLGGIKHTFGRCAITRMPALRLTATDTVFGEMTFLCLVKNNTEPTATDAFWKVESAAFSDANFSEALIKSTGYTAAYGTSPYAVIDSVDGFDVEIAAEIRQDSVDRYGVVGARLISLAATARFKPAGLTEAQIATLCAMDGASAILTGESLTKSNTNLVITGTGLVVTLYKAGIQAQDLAFGDAHRIGELRFVTRRTWTVGVADPIYALSIPV